MKKKDNDQSGFESFLKDVKPIKKSNKVKKEVSVRINPTNKKIKENERKIENSFLNFKKKSPQEFQKNTQKNLTVEKGPINKRLKNGKVPIDIKIDFHGFTLEEAKNKFLEVINNCYQKELRCILFITGKGLKKNNSSEPEERLYYGKIRNNFMKWVTDTQIRSKILAVQQANIKHGADGAFYVYLRKS